MKTKTRRPRLLDQLQENTFFGGIEERVERESVSQEEALDQLRREVLKDTTNPLYEVFGKVARQEMSKEVLLRYLRNHKKRWTEQKLETEEALRENDRVQNPIPKDVEERKEFSLRVFRNGKLSTVTLDELKNGLVVGDIYLHI